MTHRAPQWTGSEVPQNRVHAPRRRETRFPSRGRHGTSVGGINSIACAALLIFLSAIYEVTRATSGVRTLLCSIYARSCFFPLKNPRMPVTAAARLRSDLSGLPLDMKAGSMRTAHLVGSCG